ncbi:MAG TPA: MauE/DoxX family redox-associated membrane protein [Candidatus Acidoferrales bacterium]|nr:MauE/DoxX family redox-associated membrane protein [Candidatus Acidoferrales bacterium]
MESRTSIGRVLLIIGRIALAALFIYAAYAKMKPQMKTGWSAGSVRVSLSMFAMEVDSFQVLPPWAVNFVAHALPPFELFLGLWLLTGIVLRYSSLITTLLLAGFFGVLIHAYALGQEISCGCFGPGEHIGPERLLIEGCFLAVALAVTIGAFVVHRSRSSRLPEPSPVDSR